MITSVPVFSNDLSRPKFPWISRSLYNLTAVPTIAVALSGLTLDGFLPLTPWFTLGPGLMKFLYYLPSQL